MYPREEVANYIHDNFVPVQVELGNNPAIQERYGVVWTPTLLFLGEDKKLHYKQEGASFPANQFLPLLKTGRARAVFNNKNFRKSVRHYNEVIEQHGDSLFVPEALYWSGVAKLKMDDKDGLFERWDQLKEDHPDSAWATRLRFTEE